MAYLADIADFLLCSRTSIYRSVAAWCDGKLAAQWWPEVETWPQELKPARASRFSRLVAWLITQSHRVFDLCHTRWNFAALAPDDRDAHRS
jgi:hypothetical protein